MSFLKNLRSSISHKQSLGSNNDSSVQKIKILKKNSVKENKNTFFKDKQITEDNQSEGVVRSDTYTIVDENGIVLVKENTSVSPPSPPHHPVKKNMFSKFGTFTRRKNKASLPKDETKLQDDEEHHLIQDKNLKTQITPSEVSVLNSTNSDPFNVLYRQNEIYSKKKSDRDLTDYGTYRKEKLPDNIKKELEELRLEAQSLEKPYEHPDKYKTVTLSSFRKSFREQFLAQQNNVPYNPAWFVEVETLKSG